MPITLTFSQLDSINAFHLESGSPPNAGVSIYHRVKSGVDEFYGIYSYEVTEDGDQKMNYMGQTTSESGIPELLDEFPTAGIVSMQITNSDAPLFTNSEVVFFTLSQLNSLIPSGEGNFVSKSSTVSGHPGTYDSLLGSRIGSLSQEGRPHPPDW